MKQLVFLFAIILCFTSCDNYSLHPIAEARAADADDRIIGIWKVEEDTNKNNFYEVYKSKFPHQYHVRFWNRGGTNPTFEANAYFSKVRNARFLNVPYWESGAEDDKPFKNRGYLFFKILKEDKDFTHVTIAVVADTTLKYLKSSKEVTALIMRNLNNPTFYTDTAHFFKIRKKLK